MSLVLVDHILEVGPISSVRWIAQRLGWMGVMLFFVHTSLVLMFSLQRTRAGGSALLRHFYLRRAFRIYPLSAVVILIIIALQIPVANISWHLETITPSTVLGNLLLIQNLFYIPNVLGPLWSLPLEVQMYALLPFLFWMVGRGTRLGRAVTLVLVFMGLAFVQQSITNRANVLQFAPCFMGGIIAYCLTKRRAAIWPFWTWGIALAGAMTTYLGVASFFTDVEPMVLSWGLGLFVGSVAPNISETRSRLIRSGSAVVAKYSYGIYLTHMPAFWIAFVRVFPTNYGAAILLSLALTSAFSFVAFHLVESPCIGIGSRLAMRFLDATIQNAAPASASDGLIAPVSS